MAKLIRQLDARRVATETRPGRHADGGGLFLNVTQTKAGKLSRRWTMKYTFKGRVREMGLGSADLVNLATARRLADEARAKILAGGDPVGAKRSERERVATIPTFAEAAEAHIREREDATYEDETAREWTSKTAAAWRAAVANHCGPLLKMPVDEIRRQDILDVLQPLAKTKYSTARKLAQRIESILGSALLAGHIDVNPGEWRNNISKGIPKRKASAVKHRQAVPPDDAPAFIERIRGLQERAASMFLIEFIALTACRVGEACGARWSEIDLKSKVWTIPPERTKTRKQHRVPLSTRAIQILEVMKRRGRGDFVFSSPSATGHFHVSTAVIMLRKLGIGADIVTPHGLRATFRSWAQTRQVPWNVAEACLGHALPATARAYARSDLLEERRPLMEAWCAYLDGVKNDDNVVQFAARV